jgi:hypothetical protein
MKAYVTSFYPHKKGGMKLSGRRSFYPASVAAAKAKLESDGWIVAEIVTMLGDVSVIAAEREQTARPHNGDPFVYVQTSFTIVVP